MTNLFLHTWAQSSKKAGGVNMRAFVIAVIRSGGLTFTAQCPEDDECYSDPQFNPRALKSAASNATSTTKATESSDDVMVKEAFTVMLQTIQALQARITALENTISAKPDTTGGIEVISPLEPLEIEE